MVRLDSTVDVVTRPKGEVMERAALAKVLKLRRAGAFVSGTKMDDRLTRMLARKRQAHAVRD